MDNLLPVFIGLTALAVLLQAGLLAAMYLAMRKTSARMESLANEVKSKALPAIDSAQGLITELRPKLQVIADRVEVIADNLSNATSTVRAQVERVDAAVNDVVDRARLQVIRADDLLGRTLDRVEETSEIVHKTVTSPVRQVTGIIQGVTTGIEYFFSRRGQRNGRSRIPGRPVPQDEMFI
jgi:methyl-accepting chemotaxis protein